MADIRPDNPGVIASPPLIALGCIALGLLLDWIYPSPAVPADMSPAWRYAIGGVLSGLGVALVATAIGLFKKAGTNFRTEKTSTVLITDGFYRYSRNPIYIGLTTAYIGVGIVANSLWVLALVFLFVGLLRYGVIAREERYLEDKFGDAYSAYKLRVRRWL